MVQHPEFAGRIMLHSSGCMDVKTDAAKNLDTIFAHETPKNRPSDLTIQSEVDLHLIAIEVSQIAREWLSYFEAAQPDWKRDGQYTHDMLFVCIQHLRKWACAQEQDWYAPTLIAHVNDFSSTLISIDREITGTYMYPTARILWSQLIRISTRLARHYNIVPPTAALSLCMDAVVRERIRQAVAREKTTETVQNARKSRPENKAKIYSLMSRIKSKNLLQYFSPETQRYLLSKI